MKAIRGIYTNPVSHWVGDGFPVRTLFSYNTLGEHVSPFLLLDYAGPAEFAPGISPRGVGEHPHRGFETVTIVYKGEVEHHDSAGNGGLIGPGDVQWMTAGSGLLHEELHSEEFTRRGGTLEMAQLWVNLPAKDKMSPPRYQTILDADIPSVALEANAGRIRVIAGSYAGVRGPAATFTELDVWDMQLHGGHTVSLPVRNGHNTVMAVLRGAVTVNAEKTVGEATVVTFDPDGDEIRIEANAEATLLLLSGEPLREPIAGHGPFVMNTQEEIAQAIKDLRLGRFERPRNPVA
ncbi:MAG: pirin family protein [Rhodospirillaceae bacterium]